MSEYGWRAFVIPSLVNRLVILLEKDKKQSDNSLKVLGFLSDLARIVSKPYIWPS